MACASAVTLSPPPPAAEAHEAGAYGGGAPRLARAAAPVLRAFDRHRLALLRRAGAAPPGTLLDVGAGRGRFVAAARAAGWDAQGIEPSARGVDGALAAGVMLQRCGIEDAAVAPASQDAVTLWHVLEHLEEPAGALRRIAGWLAPGGVLLAGVPNVGSAQARAGGPRWFHLDVPRHRTHFSVAGLHAALRAAGLEPLATHHVLAEHNPFGMWQSLASRATPTPSFLYHLLKRNATARPADVAGTLAALALAPAAALAELLAGAVRRGGTVAVAARRTARD